MGITISLDTKAINKAIKQINEYKESIRRKEEALVYRLAELGCTKAQLVFSNFTEYDGINDVTVEFNASGTEATISAKGQAVAFIEFGAGVYYNGTSGIYPMQKPSSISGIGQYGKGYGKRNTWVYYEEDEEGKKNKVFTHGNPPAMAMYKTIVELKEEIGEIAKEVFRS